MKNGLWFFYCVFFIFLLGPLHAVAASLFTSTDENTQTVAPGNNNSTLSPGLQQQQMRGYSTNPLSNMLPSTVVMPRVPSRSGVSENTKSVSPTGKEGGTGVGTPFEPPPLSDTEKARLTEYRKMSDTEKNRIADYCKIYTIQKDKMQAYSQMSNTEKNETADFLKMLESYSKMTEAEKTKSAEYLRMSDDEKTRVSEYSNMSIIEKARLAEYCGIVDVEKGRAAELEEDSDIEKSMDLPEADDELFKPQTITNKKLVQFGYNFFKPNTDAFAPLNDIPVGDDYAVGPGDRIMLQLWGSIDGTFELEVNRSGEVLLPRVGAVKVWGVSFGRLPEVFREKLSKVFKNFQLNVNVGKLRLMKVYVVGEVKSPGDYNITSLSTVINALSAAGGPTKNGSLRKILIKRSGNVVDTVDLYDFFLKGDKSRDIRLQQGDTIYVPVIQKVAAVSGNVRRPAIYELNNEKSLTDLLALADGINPNGYLQRIQLVRVNANERKLVSDFNIDPQATEETFRKTTGAIPIQNLDMVRVFSINATLRDNITLEGYVLRPGNYAMKPGMRLRDLFSNGATISDNLLPETYKDVAVITRNLPPDYRPEKITVNLGKALDGDESQNLELREFDRVKVFSRWEMEEKPKVTISGEIQKPGEYRLFDKMRLRDLIYDAGNLKKTAYLNNAEISRIKLSDEGATSEPIIVNLKEVLSGNPDHNILLQNYDSVQIRRLPNWMEEKERSVILSGEVVFPGTYPIYKGERLSSVLARAGGYTPKAYPFGAKFTREQVRLLQQQRMDDYIFKSEQDINQKMQELSSVATSKEELDATKASLQGLKQNLDKLKQLKAEGRVTIHLSSNAPLAGTPYDLELMGGDTLDIPQSPGTVQVMGEVYNPTTLLFFPEKTLSYYLNSAGGPDDNAEEDEIYVVKADGSVFSKKQASFGIHWDPDAKSWSMGGFDATQMHPGDTIVVPRQLERTAWLRTIKDIATILGQAALMAGVILK